MNLDPVANQRQISYTSLAPFLLMTFGLAWGILGLFILLPEPTNAIFGELTGQHPLFFLAVWSPAIATFIIVTYHSGIGGLQRYLTRLRLWRCSMEWYVFLTVGIPILFFSGSALKGNLFAEPFLVSSVQSLMVEFALTAIKGPIEEFGWRGLALPLLQRKFAPIWSGLILGALWGFWHLPAFLLSGTPQSAWSFTPFWVGSIALSAIVTALFNASRGSILLPMLFHFQCNNPIWPDVQPYDTVVFVVAAVLVVWFDRKAMFRKASAAIDVIPTAVNRANSSQS
jgi:uncharacterized protein